MKSFWIDGARWGLLLLASSAGCALVGYNFGDYKPADASGAGGTAAASTQSSAASQPTGASESAGVGGKSGSSGAGGPGGSAGEGGSGSGGESSSGECTTNEQCTDMDSCTVDRCDDSQHCAHDKIDDCCPHSVCETGAPLDAATCKFDDPTKGTECIADVCGTTASCCLRGWDEGCVEAAKTACLPKNGSVFPSYTCLCTHPYCKTGPALSPGCDPCVHAVCEALQACCDPLKEWTEGCVAATYVYCHAPPGSECQ